ncbi:flagellar motor control protein ZomB [Prescottella agglutinans]|uniref:Arabinofuranosyltransferase n=1 Tax=Prescottella agglutinans TaxID=1644129 RepID=A0ABT6ME92_9NOCA|nr:arabinofuranosyltransferase [Prescottella agglutinans]
MSLSTSSEPTRTADEPAVEPRPQGAWISRAVFVGGVVLTALLFAWGAWQRRWIADDGLIVLRTVRNLLAGNGPVFNAGERVEANTSTLWTYLVYAFGWITQARLEYVVLGLALVLSVSAVVLAMIGTARLYRARFRGGLVLLLPAGAIVYIAVPPARDFATSGLESCLVIFWLALVWFLLVRWAQNPAPSWRSVLLLAFVAGLGPLVRPEMAIVGGLALLLVFLAPIGWKLRAWIVAAAGVAPVAYQIWRMGYYALPYPNTAVSKDAGGAKWSQGFAYLWNLVGPYVLWLPLLLLAVAIAMAWWREPARPADRSERDVDHSAGSVWARYSRRLHSPAAVVVFILGCGLILAIYSIRVGGDFMHGRVLLPALFCFIIPISVIPIRVLPRAEWGRNNATLAFAVSVVAWLATMVWAIAAANTVGMPTGSSVGKSGIVDERAFYSLNTGHRHPILAEDYLDYPRMRAMVQAIADTPDGGLLLPTPSFTNWDVVPPPVPIPEGGAGHTVYFLNLGMTSMNVGLDVKVLDQMGLAYPIAAHTERLEGGRIGHDKVLYPDWVVADTGMVPVHPWLPWYLDEDWVAQARVALTCPETVELKESYSSELDWPLFKRNLRNALDYAGYRFDRVPKYEIERCDLEMPEPLGNR